MNKFDKPVQFPSAYLPEGKRPDFADPFGNTMRGLDNPKLPTPGPEGPPGTGGGIPDLDIRNGVTGAVIDAGTETLTIGGKDIYWVQFRMNSSGAASYVLQLSSLPYATSL